MKTALFALLILVAPMAQAFTPESGLWWNPNEAGRGFGIDVQNETLVITTFVYTENGAPVWYQGVADLNGNTVAGELARKFGGQCITCSYTAPETQPGFAGPFEIVFDSETTGVLTWAGGSIPIERFTFGYADPWDKMLGEWQIVLNFSGHPSIGDDYPYFGDILVFTSVVSEGNRKDYLGFRLNSEFDRTGTGVGDAAGTYDPEDDVQIIVVDDDETDELLLYVLEVGTDSFSGFAEFYDEDAGPSFQGHPVEGVRTRTQAEVLNNATQKARAAFDYQPGMQSSPRFSGFAIDRAPVGLEAFGKSIKRARLHAIVQRLEKALR